MKAFFVSQTQETAKVIIALADRADASTEQNTSSSRQGVYRLRCHCCEIHRSFMALHFRLLILYIEYSGF